MKVIETEIPDVRIIEPQVFGDACGFFMETWSRRDFAAAGIDADFAQDNHSRSVQGTLRGLHYQTSPHTQGKLVRVTIGEVFDVAVDLRHTSPTFGRWVGVMLSAENHRQLWVPPGFAHGFYVVSEVAEFQYKCTDYCAPEHERCIRWDDPELRVEWPLIACGSEPLLSDKDRVGVWFADAEVYNLDVVVEA